jgi:glyoxylase I family protein
VAAFEVRDLPAAVERLRAAGVVSTQPRTQMGPVSIAVCSDTCGNLIQLYQPSAR